MDLSGSEANHVKANPDKDNGNNLSASSAAASPHRAINRLMCSMLDTLSYLENLEKSGILYVMGKGTWSKDSG